MVSKKIFIFMLNLGLIFFISGCGTKGGTSIIAYSPSAPLKKDEVPTLNLSSLILIKGGTKLVNIGTPSWGEFNKDGSDLHILRQSFEETINNSNKLAIKKNSPLNVHVIINRYLVAHSNNTCVAVACISWCLAEENEKILFKETFFAANQGRFLTTIGAIKDDTNRNIIARIMEKSLNFNQAKPAIQIKNTSNDFNEIIKILPAKLASLDINAINYGLYKYAVFAKKNMIWDWVNYSSNINWEKHFKKQHLEDKE